MGSPAVNPIPSGVTFDAAPLQQATTVNVPAPAGVTFDDAPTSKATTVTVPAPANQPQQAQPSSTPTATISAVQKPTGAAAVEQWADDVKNDLLNGTTNTKVGALLHFLGAPGLAKGVSPEVTDSTGSPLLGPTQALKGAAELPQSGKRWQGAKNTVGGVLNTLTIPGAIASPEAGELAGADGEAALNVAGRAAKATGNAISKPSSLQAVQDALENSHADIQRAFETGTLRSLWKIAGGYQRFT